jgi:hypothetical protein
VRRWYMFPSGARLGSCRDLPLGPVRRQILLWLNFLTGCCQTSADMQTGGVETRRASSIRDRDVTLRALSIAKSTKNGPKDFSILHTIFFTASLSSHLFHFRMGLSSEQAVQSALNLKSSSFGLSSLLYSKNCRFQSRKRAVQKSGAEFSSETKNTKLQQQQQLHPVYLSWRGTKHNHGISWIYRSCPALFE